MVMLAGDIMYADDINAFVPQLITQQVLTSDSSTWDGTAEVQVGTLTATLVNGVRYELRVHANVSAATANDASILRVHEDNTAGTQLCGPQIVCPTTTSVGYCISFWVQYTAVASASKTFVLTGRNNAGTGLSRIRAATTRPAYFQLWRVP